MYAIRSYYGQRLHEVRRVREAKRHPELGGDCLCDLRLDGKYVLHLQQIDPAVAGTGDKLQRLLVFRQQRYSYNFV